MVGNRPRIPSKTPRQKLLDASKQVNILHNKFELYKAMQKRHNQGKTIEYSYQELTDRIAALRIEQKAATKRLRTLALEGGKEILYSLSEKKARNIRFQTGISMGDRRDKTGERNQLRGKLKGEYPQFQKLIKHLNTVYGPKQKKRVQEFVLELRTEEGFYDFLDQLPEEYRIPILYMKGGKRPSIDHKNEGLYVSSSGAYNEIKKGGKTSIISTPMQT